MIQRRNAGGLQQAACPTLWPVLTVAEAFDRWAGIDLLATAPAPLAPDPLAPAPLAPDVGRLAEAARPLGIAPGPDDRREDLFFRIFLDRIEPQLGRGAPLVLTDYPLSMASPTPPASRSASTASSCSPPPPPKSKTSSGPR